ncbi:fructose-bisphosphate aldolase C-like isoform X2 [Tigriopus californicus]|uniref:fructose-bisphosphate aldolase C-like isoform X2 n=1 Tax=Tigriopus californicus TaxID=6832 RepID=UPI0027DA48F8|nr:fructose-bisphosphate aldolase C-like isoform X2 [Tigriopus californicus]
MTRSSHLNAESQAELTRIVRRICQKGKGILAADETPMAMEDRFQNLNITNSDENRRLYRQLLFTTPKSEISSLSAVILQHETVYQKLDDGRDFIQAVNDIGIVPGITLDKGWRAIPGHPGEVFTQGLDDLDARCKTYKSLGLHFAKWRMAITIQGETVPSKTMIDEGVRSLALYALICQTNGIVPIVEPDISRIGDHSWQRQQEVFELVNNKLYEVLKDYGVFIEGTILKCSMVTAGKTNAQGATPQQRGSGFNED